jgi:hypothetical protein
MAVEHAPVPSSRCVPTLKDDGGFQATFGPSLESVLDVNTWRTGDDLDTIYDQVSSQLEAALRQEARVHNPIRTAIFQRLRDRRDAPPGAGVYRASVDDLKRIHSGLLFTGAVEACDATRYTHDTLPLTVTQIGVCLVAYNGALGTWVQRLFRRDLREAPDDPIAEALALIERRDDRGGLNQPSRDELSDLARQAIMTYAERAILLRRSAAIWRMGHGNPAPWELLTGSAVTLGLTVPATRLLEELICEHQKFVFVPSEPAARDLLTIGNTLQPLEFAIADSLDRRIQAVLSRTDFRALGPIVHDGQSYQPNQWIARFRDEVASQVVVGVYRASDLAPPQIFYAHAEHGHQAALIALADSILQPHRGFPMLLDLADRMCAMTFGPESLAGPLQRAYTRAGVPLRYLSERMTRHR